MHAGLLGSLVLVAAATWTVGCGPRLADLSYDKDVRPILTAKCSRCHAPGQPGFVASGLDTTSHAALMAGGKRGRLVRPGDEFTSTRDLLLAANSHGREQLTHHEYAVLKVWVCEGAKDN